MYICLCIGVTSAIVEEAIHEGARSTKQVAVACGAGSVCGRCRHNVRVLLDAAAPDRDNRKRDRLRRLRKRS
jgi:bacterioferritin-associated ferredoxin